MGDPFSRLEAEVESIVCDGFPCGDRDAFELARVAFSRAQGEVSRLHETFGDVDVLASDLALILLRYGEGSFIAAIDAYERAFRRELKELEDDMRSNRSSRRFSRKFG